MNDWTQAHPVLTFGLIFLFSLALLVPLCSLVFPRCPYTSKEILDGLARSAPNLRDGVLRERRYRWEMKWHTILSTAFFIPMVTVGVVQPALTANQGLGAILAFSFCWTVSFVLGVLLLRHRYKRDLRRLGITDLIEEVDDVLHQRLDESLDRLVARLETAPPLPPPPLSLDGVPSVWERLTKD